MIPSWFSSNDSITKLFVIRDRPPGRSADSGGDGGGDGGGDEKTGGERAAVLLRRQRSCRNTRSAVAANTPTTKMKERGIAPPSVNHEKVMLDAEDSAGAAAAPGRHAAAAARNTADARLRAGQEAPHPMARSFFWVLSFF